MPNTTKLPIEFIGLGEVKGFHFKQIEENTNGYIYKVFHDGAEHYEVVIKKVSPTCIDFENKRYDFDELKEIYPKSNQFGISGFTYNNYTDAKVKFDLINKNLV